MSEEEIDVSINRITPLDDFTPPIIEVEVSFSGRAGESMTHRAKVIVKFDKAEYQLSELKAAAIQRAKEFMARCANLEK